MTTDESELITWHITAPDGETIEVRATNADSALVAGATALGYAVRWMNDEEWEVAPAQA